MTILHKLGSTLSITESKCVDRGTVRIGCVVANQAGKKLTGFMIVFCDFNNVLGRVKVWNTTFSASHDGECEVK